MKNNEIENYVFLGLPKSGKTTYFSVMTHELQKDANREANVSINYLPTEGSDITMKYIKGNYFRLKEQRWPPKTQYESRFYSLMFSKKQSFMKSSCRINFFDYPGEAFVAAFGESNEDIPEEAKGLGVMIRNNIKTAKGIFLILDADEIFNTAESSEEMKYEMVLTHLFSYIQEQNRDIKFAVIFNKLELFYDEKYEPMGSFSRKFGNAFSILRQLNYRSFNVFPLGHVAMNEEGEICPPGALKPRSVLAPMKWMLEL